MLPDFANIPIAAYIFIGGWLIFSIYTLIKGYYCKSNRTKKVEGEVVEFIKRRSAGGLNRSIAEITYTVEGVVYKFNGRVDFPPAIPGDIVTLVYPPDYPEKTMEPTFIKHQIILGWVSLTVALILMFLTQILIY